MTALNLNKSLCVHNQGLSEHHSVAVLLDNGQLEQFGLGVEHGRQSDGGFLISREVIGNGPQGEDVPCGLLISESLGGHVHG